MNSSAAPAPDLTDLTFSVHGMTCASCVARVEKAIKAVEGVASATINLATEKASLYLLRGIAIEAVVAAVAKDGYEVPTETVSLAISGMICASCLGRVEAALKKVPGVTYASVNLATERAQVTAIGVAVETLISAVARAGYDAAILNDPAASKDELGRRLPSWWPVGVAALLSLPLLVPMQFMPLGYEKPLTRPERDSVNELRCY